MSSPRMTLVPHTHWDREWYEPFDAFLERLVAMMDTLLELAEAGFPHFHLDGQTAMVDDYLAVRPERLADVQRLAGLGRLSIGPWVTQMDEFLTSGESHLRNLEMGLARARELGGGLEIGYLPDQFGHVGQMPQILRTAGISRAVVWRGVPGAVDRSVFRWEAPDGSVVLTEYLAFGYFLGADLHTFRTPEALADALRRKVEQIRPFLATDDVLVMVGSDHAGPDATLPDRLTAAEPLFPEAGARVGSLEDHLDGPQPEDVPTWRGELRSSARAHLLPNVYSARAHQKRERGRVEALVERSAEPLAALVEGFAWPQERLDRIWTLLLWNGAHDSACGCSHDRVASDVDGRFAEARGLAEAIVEEALAALGEQVAEGGTIRFNPCPFARDGVPGLGWRVDPAPPPVEWDPVEVAVAEGGWIAVDDRLRLTLLDEPDVGDLYNFCFADEDQVPDRPELRNSRGEVEARWRDLTVRLVVRRRVGERVYRLEGAIENARPDHRLRLCVALPESVNGSVAGSPFELVARPLRSEGSDLEAPSATWPARHVVLAGEVAAYHEGVFEYEVSGPELFVTLLRSVGTISRERLATRPWPAGPDVPTPDAQMIGTTRFSLGLEPDAGRDRLLPTWERFALPLSEAIARGGGELAATGSLLEISGDAVLSSVRRRAGAVEVRLWNPRADAPADATIAGRDVRLGPARIETFPAA